MPSRIKNRSFLTPEDAIHPASSLKRQPVAGKVPNHMRMCDQTFKDELETSRRGKHRNNSQRQSSRRRKGSWKKLLWVKQSYPDNYTDQETFLEHLQRNPRLQPYDFWPLVADSTVIVQHVCSVIIFILCFVGIFKENISPISVVGWGSIATLLGWILWDSWVGGQVGGRGASIGAGTKVYDIGNEEEDDSEVKPNLRTSIPTSYSNNNSASNSMISLQSGSTRSSFHVSPNSTFPGPNIQGQNGLVPRHSHSASASSIISNTSITPRAVSNSLFASNLNHDPNQLSPRTSHRLSTVKSALLIYFTLLGLSPILKSLTRSTSSDSIWTMSFLLFTINIFFFDYGPSNPSTTSSVISTNKNIPASLSTNAALMASTVLASRLPSTGQVFSLTLFSIEVFGLFPVFRHDLRQRSWRGHVCLTTLLVLGSGGGVGLIVASGEGMSHEGFPYKSFGVGLILGVILTALAMGGCSWWLIDLQKYKNEIHGPWDPARPVIRRAWGDEY